MVGGEWIQTIAMEETVWTRFTVTPGESTSRENATGSVADRLQDSKYVYDKFTAGRAYLNAARNNGISQDARGCYPAPAKTLEDQRSTVPVGNCTTEPLRSRAVRLIHRAPDGVSAHLGENTPSVGNSTAQKEVAPC